MNLKDIIKRPLITEKAMAGISLGDYSFAVDRKAGKAKIKEAVEKFFKVHVKGIRTSILKGKTRRVGKARLVRKSSVWKKAVVRLAEGERIEYFEAGGEAKETK